MSEHPPGPYACEGLTIYALTEMIDDRHRRHMVNLFSARVERGQHQVTASPDQLEAIAELFAAAPETAAERDRLRGRMEKLRWMVQSGYPRKNILEEFDAALAKQKEPADADEKGGEL